MSDILTITLNPTVDLSSFTDRVVPEEKLRCSPPRVDPGGGGTNVARAIGLLGGQARAFVAVGGHVGGRLVALLQDEGIDPLTYTVPGETRQSLAVTDQGSGLQYRFVMPGPQWDGAHVADVLDVLEEEAPAGGYVVLSGSQPPGVPAEFPGLLAGRLAARDARLIIDTSGPPMHALLEDRHPAPWLLRLDKSESEGLAGRALGDMSGFADFADSLIARGVARVVVLALGPDGSVLSDGTRRWHSAAAKVPVVSKVGAGDSFVGAMTWALAQGAELPEALQRGVAAASAAVMTDATRLCRREDAERLIAECPLREV